MPCTVSFHAYADAYTSPDDPHDYAATKESNLGGLWAAEDVLRNTWKRSEFLSKDDHVWLEQTQEVCAGCCDKGKFLHNTCC